MASKRPRAALIFNPASGRATDDLGVLKDGLEPHFDLKVLSTCVEKDADLCAKEALSARPDLVIAAGGDGTVSLVASALVKRKRVALGIVPRGTSNSIAAGLNLAGDVEGALKNLLEGRARSIDTARANRRTMVLHASVGFHAATVGGTARDDKNRWGVLAYVKEGLANLGSLEPFLVEIETEDEVVRCRAVNVTVANFAPVKTLLAQGPAVISPEDGQLDVTIVCATGIAEAVATGFHLLRTALQGEAASRDNVGYLSARRVRIRTDPPQPILVDGEPVGMGTLSVQCLPASLRVILPDAPTPPKSEEKKLEGLPDLVVEPSTGAA